MSIGLREGVMSARARGFPRGATPTWGKGLRVAVRGLGCWLAVALAILVGGAGWAHAATGHGFLLSLTEAPLGARLLEPVAVASDGASGRVFVGDRLSGYVDVYRPSGEYVARFGEAGMEIAGVAVDESSGEVYVVDSYEEAVLVYEPYGESEYRMLGRWLGQATPGGSFRELAGVAVDNSGGVSAGDVYVAESRAADLVTGAVDVFKPTWNGGEGEFVRRLGGGKIERPNGVAVSAVTGRVLVAESANGAVLAYSAGGVFEEKLTGKGSPYGSFKGKGEETGNVAGLAIDGTTGELYVTEAERHVVSQYSADGVWEGWITNEESGELTDPCGVALTPGGEVDVADAGQATVDVFGPGVVVPDVKTGKVGGGGLTRTTAVLKGTVNGDGKPSSYRFQYGETPSLGQETAAKGSGGEETKVTAEVTGLHAGRTYFFRVAASNENGISVGLVGEFETPPAVEGVLTGGVQGAEPETAILTGELLPGGLDTHYYFEWGTGTSYGHSTPVPPGTDAGSGTSTVAADTRVEGLVPNTLYHYRLVVRNEEYGTTYGQDRTFTTPGPPVVCAQPATAIGQEAATVNACVNPEQTTTTYQFEYGETTSYGSAIPSSGQSVGSGSTPVTVSAVLTGLKVGTTYHYRVIAENAAGRTIGPDQIVTTVSSAPVDATYASRVSAGEATLNARINPLGHDTSYYFQYGTHSCQSSPGACTESPLPPGEDIGGGNEDTPVELKLSGLAPDTTYYFRVLASNTLGATEGPEQTFTTQQQAGTFALPDNRAWEMVTPPDKQGAAVDALAREGGLIITSDGGNALTYVVSGALGQEVQGNRSPESQQVLATRSGGGWRSRDIATPSSEPKGLAGGNAPEYQFFNTSLSAALDEPAEPGPAPPLAPGVTQATPYLRDNPSGTFLPLVTETNTQAGTQFGGRVRFLSATPDLSHIVIASVVALTGVESSRGLYEWSGGQLRYVSVLPNGLAPSGEVELGFFNRVLAHAISDDGSRIVWSQKTENSGRGRLYMRDVTRGQTIRIDRAQGAEEPAASSAQFQTASSDGTRVFFTDKQRLTPDSTAEPAQAQATGGPDLYLCNMVEVAGKVRCNLQDLTVDHNQNEHASVQNFVFGASEDGTTLYIVAQGALAGNTNGNGETAQPGKNNLYELHYDGSQWITTFIATLSSEDGPEWEGSHLADTAFLTARVSPNGRYLAFMSAAPLTGYDNVDANPVAKGARDEEVFLYDSTTASLRCVSCNPSGARPTGVLDTSHTTEGLGLLVDRRKVWAEVGNEHWLAGNIPGWTAQTLTSALFQSRYLSDEGRLYFNSPDNLVPAAMNGKEDVYEYEPSGVGSCVSATGGCVSLISGGSSDHESSFVEATPDGSNVFFVTEAQLLPQDTDTAFDIYDARECSEGSPCLTSREPSPAPCAEVATCRPAETAQPIPGGTVGTAAFSGPGNATTHVAAAKQETRARKASKLLTRAQKLKRALKRCRKRHLGTKRKRRVCKRRARKRYGKNKAKANRTSASAKTSGGRSRR
jgi:phosphodiesterase/alkaline phosphatase D-like protein